MDDARQMAVDFAKLPKLLNGRAVERRRASTGRSKGGARSLLDHVGGGLYNFGAEPVLGISGEADRY